MIGNDYKAYVENDYNAIYHYGVKGQKKGIRRYQNPDGSLTAEGKRRYGRAAAIGGAIGGGAGALGYVGARAMRKRKHNTSLAIYKPGLGPHGRRSMGDKMLGRAKSAAGRVAKGTEGARNAIRRGVMGVDKNGILRGGKYKEIKFQAPAIRKSGGMIPVGSVKKHLLTPALRKGLNRKTMARIGAAAGAAAIGTGIYYGVKAHKKRARKKARAQRR